jgi:hypothetical protein
VVIPGEQGHPWFRRTARDRIWPFASVSQFGPCPLLVEPDITAGTGQAENDPGAELARVGRTPGSAEASPVVPAFSVASSTDVQPVDLVFQQRQRILRVLQIGDEVIRGTPDVARDTRVFQKRLVEVDENRAE